MTLAPAVPDVHRALSAALEADSQLLRSLSPSDAATRILMRLMDAGVELRRSGDPAFHLVLPVTRDVVATADPSALAGTQAMLEGLLSREPLRSGRGQHAADRTLLGALAIDLMVRCSELGEPTGAKRDLRDARTRRDELDARIRLESAEAAFDRDVTDAIEQERAMRAARDDEPLPLPDDPDQIPDWL